MPRLGGSSSEGRDEGKKRRSHPLGRGGSAPGGTNNNIAEGGYHGSSINDHNDDSFRSSHHGDDEEQDRLLPSSSSGSVNRPAARRVHSAYAGAAGCGNLSSRWVGIVMLVTVGLVLRNALVNVRYTHTIFPLTPWDFYECLCTLLLCFIHPQDYRGEMIDKLRKAGTSAEDIDRLFPKSFEEKKQKVLDDHQLLESLHGAVAALRVEVDEIKEHLAASGSSLAAATGVDTKQEVHQQQQPHPPPS
jgi:hypothetical protein